MNNDINCRFCGGSLAEFVDLGMSPLCESYLAKDQLNSMERSILSPPLFAATAFSCSSRNMSHRRISFRNMPIFRPIPMLGSITRDNM